MMSSSPEYEAIKNCRVILESVFKGCERKQVHFLREEGFITESVGEDVLNPRSMLTEEDKAGKLIDGVCGAVFRDEIKFHILIRHLKSDKFYESTAKHLSEKLTRINEAKEKSEAHAGSRYQNATALSQDISRVAVREQSNFQEPTGHNESMAVASFLLPSTLPKLDDIDSPCPEPSVSYNVELKGGAKVRNYQTELAQPGIEGKNYIMIAPTGSGKTLAAALVIADHLNKHKSSHVVFITETKPLANQQQKALTDFIPNAKVVAYTGDNPGAVIADSIKMRNNISVCTAGKLLDEMKAGFVTFDQLSLIVFDECHHAKKGHLFAKLMELYFESRDNPKRVTKMPQVIGMTASPGAGDNPNLEESKTIDHLLNLAARMDATEGFKVITENLDELRQHRKTSDFNIKCLSSRDVSADPFYTETVKEMKRLEELVSNYNLKDRDFSKCSQLYEAELQKAKNDLELTTKLNVRDDISTLSLLRCYSNALSMYMDLQQKDAVQVIMEHKDLPDDDDKCTSRERDMKEGLKTLLSKFETFYPEKNPLLESVGRILYDTFQRNRQARCILFVRTKRHAHGLCDWASENPHLKDTIVPKVITGQQTGETGEGMNQVTQGQVMKAFHEGRANLLIATSVAEEGIDVPECNLMIRYQHVTNEIAKMQTQGRARSDNSHCYLISSDSSKEYKEFKNQELNHLVDEVLEKKCLPTGEKLREVLVKIQHDIMVMKRLKSLRKEQRELSKRKNVVLSCRKCQTFACYGSDVYTFCNESGLSTHYVVPCDSFKIKYTPKPHHKPGLLMSELPTIKKNEKIYCSTCDYDWGVRCFWEALGQKFPVIKCQGFVFKVDGVPRTIKKWKEAPFPMEPLKTWLRDENNSDDET